MGTDSVAAAVKNGAQTGSKNAALRHGGDKGNWLRYRDGQKDDVTGDDNKITGDGEGQRAREAPRTVTDGRLVTAVEKHFWIVLLN